MKVILQGEIIINKMRGTEDHYRIGYLPSIDRYVLATTVPWIANYERFYFITKEEYEAGSELTDGIYEYCNQNCANERFFFGEVKRDMPPDVWEIYSVLGIHSPIAEKQDAAMKKYYICYKELFYPKYIAPANNK